MIFQKRVEFVIQHRLSSKDNRQGLQEEFILFVQMQQLRVEMLSKETKFIKNIDFSGSFNTI